MRRAGVLAQPSAGGRPVAPGSAHGFGPQPRACSRSRRAAEPLLRGAPRAAPWRARALETWMRAQDQRQAWRCARWRGGPGRSMRRPRFAILRVSDTAPVRRGGAGATAPRGRRTIRSARRARRACGLASGSCRGRSSRAFRCMATRASSPVHGDHHTSLGISGRRALDQHHAAPARSDTVRSSSRSSRDSGCVCDKIIP